MLEDFIRSPLAQGMAGGLALVVLFLALKVVAKVVKAAVLLLIVGVVILLAIAGYCAWRDKDADVAEAASRAREAAECIRAKAEKAWNFVSPHVRGE